jgi:hypothetical protein
LVTFKADVRTLEALERLKAAVAENAAPGELPKGLRSQAIRKAILEAAERLPAPCDQGTPSEDSGTP